MEKLILGVICVLALTCHECFGKSALRGMFPDKYPPMKQNGVDPGQPVFLSPYIEKGQFQEGSFYELIFIIICISYAHIIFILL
jgi:hypothetical protein